MLSHTLALVQPLYSLPMLPRQMLFRPAALDRHKTCPCLHCKLAHHKLKTLLRKPCLLQLFSALYYVISHAVIAAAVIITVMIGTSDQAGL